MEKTITFESSIPLQKIDDQLTTALEGGSNYWYFLPVTKELEAPKDFVRNEAIHYEWLDKVYQGATLPIHDLEDENEKLGDLNMDSIKKGLKLMQEKYDNHFADMVEETGDATTADVFFQLCIMNEIVFG